MSDELRIRHHAVLVEDGRFRDVGPRALLDARAGAGQLAADTGEADLQLRIEDRKDGPHAGPADPALFAQAEETALGRALDDLSDVAALLAAEDFAGAMARMAGLRAPVTTRAESTRSKR